LSENEVRRTQRATVRRLPERGKYDRAVIDAILDEGLICHLGFVADGAPFVIPTLHGRCGDILYVHGSPASHALRSLAAGGHACVTVTLVDGLVLARSAFHHSINYRSVMLFGQARLVTDPDEKMNALQTVTEHVVRGRWAEARQPNAKELKSTTVLAFAIDEVSAKVRTGPPKDDQEDLDWPVWAGVLPLKTVAGEPVPDPALAAETPVPQYVRNYSRVR
jgi:nitroimidazol reductase NimA-like FMN-containing flavoprotein (pyridoxamine 5'-phosphate oxidase superfamily)